MLKLFPRDNHYCFLLCRLFSKNGALEKSLDDKKLRFSTGKLAKLATCSILTQQRNGAVLNSIVVKDCSKSANFMVNYKQNLSAASKIPTNFFRRDLGNSQSEILTCRLIDRALRSCIPKNCTDAIAITCDLISIDNETDVDILAINGSSLALQTGVKNFKPVAATRVCLIAGDLKINPLAHEAVNNECDLIVASDKNSKIVMLDGEADEMGNEKILKCIQAAVKENISLLKEMAHFNKNKGKFLEIGEKKDNLLQSNQESLSHELSTISFKMEIMINELFTKKFKNRDNFHHGMMEIVHEMTKNYPDNEALKKSINDEIRLKCRHKMITNKSRFDGRSFDEIRPIECEIDLFPNLHGSSLFQRGFTQVYTSLTFDSPQTSIKSDVISALHGQNDKRFFHHYTFPAYCTNELPSSKSMRREIGHGMLAEKAICRILPKPIEEKMPLTTRLNSQVLESNGSSSMASVCSSSLVLYASGVNIPRHVAGVALGMIEHDTLPNKNHFLTDITGFEDYMGDMDLKIAGTTKGITALQLDIKNDGILSTTLKTALEKSFEARCKIIEKMNTIIDTPRDTKGILNFPIVEMYKIQIEDRSKLLGIGGINIRRIAAKTGITISTVDESTFEIFAPNKESYDAATEMIIKILETQREPVLEFGRVYEAEITEIRSYGVMVKLYPSMSPVLVPNGQLDNINIKHPSVLGFSVGDIIRVKYFGRDNVNGRMRLSRKIVNSLASNQTNVSYINKMK